MSGNFEKFYNMPKDGRWLDTPYNVGGRDTDVGQLGDSLYDEVRQQYPINKVPNHITLLLEKTRNALNLADILVERLINDVSEDLINTKED